MNNYGLIGHCEVDFDRKNYRLKLGDIFREIFRKYGIKSVILAPGKETAEEKVAGGDGYTTIKTEFSTINIYPDFFKFLKYASMEEKSKAVEARLKYYGNIEIPSELGEYAQHFGEKVLVVAMFDNFLQIWDKDASDYFDEIKPLRDEDMKDFSKL
jgi:DNA-binding transcriptional regulator/RsmH inhibitor MraZ